MDFQCLRENGFISINVLFGNAGFMKSNLHLVLKKWHISMFSVDIIYSEMEKNQIGKRGQQTFTTKANTKKRTKKKRKENCSTIKANKFHRTADTITTQKANKVETPRIEFKGLITTNRGAPKQI